MLPSATPRTHLLRRGIRIAAACFSTLNLAALSFGQTDFVSSVTATHPVAYYRLTATAGKSEVGSTTYKAMGGASSGSPAAVAGDSNFVKLDGKNGYVVSTQAGGVGLAASIMAWVNLAELPSKANRIFYVAGESQSGNDLDLQFETDNILRFFTASGGNLQYAPAPDSLLNQWHMVVATLDTVTHTRVIYWDGKQAAKDTGGGEAGKTGIFSIGESTVFTGRFLHGGVEEAALWNRALKATEVAAIYAAAGSTGGAASAGAGVATGAAAGTGPFATTAKVEADDAKGPIKLQREEQIALMFLTAMEQIEHNCQLNLQRACAMSELMTGTGGQHLKFDPNKTDPNYSYTFASGGMAWEAHANAKKPGLKGFCFMARSVGTTVTTYSTSGKAGWADTEITSRGIEGDSFDAQ